MELDLGGLTQSVRIRKTWRPKDDVELTLGIDHDLQTHVSSGRFSILHRRSLPHVGPVELELSDNQALMGKTIHVTRGDAFRAVVTVKAGAKWSDPRNGVAPEITFGMDEIEPWQTVAAVGAAIVAVGRGLTVRRQVPVLRRPDGAVSAEVEVCGTVRRQGKRLKASLHETHLQLHL